MCLSFFLSRGAPLPLPGGLRQSAAPPAAAAAAAVAAAAGARPAGPALALDGAGLAAAKPVGQCWPVDLASRLRRYSCLTCGGHRSRPRRRPGCSLTGLGWAGASWAAQAQAEQHAGRCAAVLASASGTPGSRPHTATVAVEAARSPAWHAPSWRSSPPPSSRPPRPPPRPSAPAEAPPPPGPPAAAGPPAAYLRCCCRCCSPLPLHLELLGGPLLLRAPAPRHPCCRRALPPPCCSAQPPVARVAGRRSAPHA
jgi:hypothetical protein